MADDLKGQLDALVLQATNTAPTTMEDLWQPIETAPMPEFTRGPAVLVYVPTAEEADERVIVARFWGAWDECIEPTHWMPLPSPPAQADRNPVLSQFHPAACFRFGPRGVGGPASSSIFATTSSSDQR